MQHKPLSSTIGHKILTVRLGPYRTAIDPHTVQSAAPSLPSENLPNADSVPAEAAHSNKYDNKVYNN